MGSELCIIQALSTILRGRNEALLDFVKGYYLSFL
jgi:hypothetical protein